MREEQGIVPQQKENQMDGQKEIQKESQMDGKKEIQMESQREDLEVGLEKLAACSRDLLQQAEQTAEELQEYYPRLLDGERKEQLEEDVREKTETLESTKKVIWKAYQSVYEMDDELSARWKDIQNSERKTLFVSPPPANAAIDEEEHGADHFAKGLNFYKLFLLCVCGSFLGVVVEMLWRLVSKGVWESRVGLVYGPFNLLYGAGALVLTVFLYRYRNRGSWLSFLGSMLIGSGLEYGCSWLQEMIFGSRSWDYSNVPFNVGGRICLLFSVFWGILGVIWIKDVYPRITKWILKIPNKAGRIATWVLVVFFVFNSVVTVAAVYRWGDRMGKEPSDNVCWEFFDEHFTDERMRKTFPSMEFAKE